MEDEEIDEVLQFGVQDEPVHAIEYPEGADMATSIPDPDPDDVDQDEEPPIGDHTGG